MAITPYQHPVTIINGLEFNQGPNDPSVAPADPATPALYLNQTTNILWTWDIADGAWVAGVSVRQRLLIGQDGPHQAPVSPVALEAFDAPGNVLYVAAATALTAGPSGSDLNFEILDQDANVVAVGSIAAGAVGATGTSTTVIGPIPVSPGTAHGARVVAPFPVAPGEGLYVTGLVLA